MFSWNKHVKIDLQPLIHYFTVYKVHLRLQGYTLICIIYKQIAVQMAADVRKIYSMLIMSYYT